MKLRLGHTKDFLKMVPDAALLAAQQTRGRIWEVTLRRTGIPSNWNIVLSRFTPQKQGLSTYRMGRSARSTQLTNNFTLLFTAPLTNVLELCTKNIVVRISLSKSTKHHTHTNK